MQELCINKTKLGLNSLTVPSYDNAHYLQFMILIQVLHRQEI